MTVAGTETTKPVFRPVKDRIRVRIFDKEKNKQYGIGVIKKDGGEFSLLNYYGNAIYWKPAAIVANCIVEETRKGNGETIPNVSQFGFESRYEGDDRWVIEGGNEEIFNIVGPKHIENGRGEKLYFEFPSADNDLEVGLNAHQAAYVFTHLGALNEYVWVDNAYEDWFLEKDKSTWCRTQYDEYGKMVTQEVLADLSQRICWKSGYVPKFLINKDNGQVWFDVETRYRQAVRLPSKGASFLKTINGCVNLIEEMDFLISLKKTDESAYDIRAENISNRISYILSLERRDKDNLPYVNVI